MRKTTVINLRDVAAVRQAQKEGTFIRIDRRTKWGNKYRLGIDGTRAQVIMKHRHDTLHDPELIKAIKAELKGMTLACWCHPLPCHGDTYVEIADD